MSSANRKMSELFTMLGKLFMNMMKTRGPITEHWGIPLANLNMNCLLGHVEFCEPTMLQSSMFPFIPQLSSFFNNNNNNVLFQARAHNIINTYRL